MTLMSRRRRFRAQRPSPAESARRSRSAAAGSALALSLVTAIVGAHVAGSLPLRDSAWGVHQYAFHGAGVLAIAVIGLAVVVAWILAISPDRWRACGASRATLSTRRARGIVAGVGGFSALVFWAGRARHTLLGDGNVITAGLHESALVHPREPLTSLLQHGLYAMFAKGLGSEAATHEVAALAVASGSVVAGVVFVIASWFAAREIVRLTDANAFGDASATVASTANAGTIAQHGTSWLVWAVLIAQGYVQLFFGYVENYAFYAAALPLYLWGALRFLAGRTRFGVPGGIALVAIALHLSGAVLVPSLAILAAVGVTRRAWRRRTLLDATALLAVALLAAWALSRIEDGYNPFASVLGLARGIAAGAGSLGSLFSRQHLNNFVNEQLLIGPLGLLLFLVAVVAVVRKRRLDATTLFLSSLGVVQAIAVWMIVDTNLGYARDWDLFAAGGALFTAAGLGLLLQRRAVTPALQRNLALAVVVSAFHTLPWIVLNASETKSLERMKRLPLGGGRAQMVVGNWHLRNGDYYEAMSWLERSHMEFPMNISTNYLLGVAYGLNGQHERAVRVLDTAVELRPENPRYRRELIAALLATGQSAAAVPHFEHLQKRGQLSAEDARLYEAVRAELASPNFDDGGP